MRDGDLQLCGCFLKHGLELRLLFRRSLEVTSHDFVQLLVLSHCQLMVAPFLCERPLQPENFLYYRMARGFILARLVLRREAVLEGVVVDARARRREMDLHVNGRLDRRQPTRQ